jgi:hypothetical protein
VLEDSSVVEFEYPSSTTFSNARAGTREKGRHMKWNWKWAIGIGAAFVLLLVLDRSPQTLRGVQKWVSGQGASGQLRREKVSRAELLGRIEKQTTFALEVKDRLDAYVRQFGDDGRLLDEMFFEREWANDQRRAEWFELRREVPELVRKVDALIALLRSAKTSLSRGDSIEEWQDLPDEAESASDELNRSIQDRNRRVATYTKLADQLRKRGIDRRSFP